MIQTDRYTLLQGDNRELIQSIPDSSIDTIITDPPYGLGKQPDAIKMLQAWLTEGHYDVKGVGFMGKSWDAFIPQPAFWKECLRVLKPGGNIAVFAGTRTLDIMGLSLRIAGFEIRDTLGYMYGSGFPKSHNISKAIDREKGLEREVVGKVKKMQMGTKNAHEGWKRPSHFDENGNVKTTMDITAPASPEAETWHGWGTALKPAYEPILWCRKPLSENTVAQNVLRWGTGAVNIDGCRVGGEAIKTNAKSVKESFPCKTGFLGCPESYHIGRFPANIIHDGSEEVLNIFPNVKSTPVGHFTLNNDTTIDQMNSLHAKSRKGQGFNDDGSAARFFYCAKASKRDREEGLEEFEEKKAGCLDGSNNGTLNNGQPTYSKNTHPTVKPTALMQYLCRLFTPPNGTILDPFMGSGSTGKAAMYEGFAFIGMEQDIEYFAIANARIKFAAKDKVTDDNMKLFNEGEVSL